MATKTTTTSEPEVKKELTILQRQKDEKRTLLAHYKNEKKVPCSVSPLYAPYFGKVMQVQINGITIAFPINGSTQEIPETFADEIKSRVMAIDNTIFKASKMSDIRNNAEVSPGALTMF